ncbi:MAG: hypothetical protein GY717_06970, partial [Rhodobacteraceae bacterium]|nr:hypothetical protein [Paracoccaceae bacterium]
MSLTLECPQSMGPEARALMAALAPVKPETLRSEPPASQTRDPATLIALASLVLSVPGAVLATLEVKERLDRRDIKPRLDALKERLSVADGSARLHFPSGASMDLARTSTDAAIDMVIREL